MSIKLPDGTVIVGQTHDRNAVHITGGTMTGPLILSGPPVQPLQAVPKQYLDEKIGNIGLYSTVTEYVDGKIEEKSIKWRQIE